MKVESQATLHMVRVAPFGAMTRGEEARLEDEFCEWLESVGARVLSRSRGKVGGPDVVARYNDRDVVFELKTDRPKGEGRSTDERGVDYPTLLGQILMRMSDAGKDYAVLFPEAGLPWFRGHYPPYVWKRTGIRAFVWKGNRAQELEPDYSEKSLSIDPSTKTLG